VRGAFAVCSSSRPVSLLNHCLKILAKKPAGELQTVLVVYINPKWNRMKQGQCSDPANRALGSLHGACCQPAENLSIWAVRISHCRVLERDLSVWSCVPCGHPARILLSQCQPQSSLQSQWISCPLSENRLWCLLSPLLGHGVLGRENKG